MSLSLLDTWSALSSVTAEPSLSFRLMDSTVISAYMVADEGGSLSVSEGESVTQVWMGATVWRLVVVVTWMRQQTYFPYVVWVAELPIVGGWTGAQVIVFVLGACVALSVASCLVFVTRRGEEPIPLEELGSTPSSDAKRFEPERCAPFPALCEGYRDGFEPECIWMGDGAFGPHDEGVENWTGHVRLPFEVARSARDDAAHPPRWSWDERAGSFRMRLDDGVDPGGALEVCQRVECVELLSEAEMEGFLSVQGVEDLVDHDISVSDVISS